METGQKRHKNCKRDQIFGSLKFSFLSFFFILFIFQVSINARFSLSSKSLRQLGDTSSSASSTNIKINEKVSNIHRNILSNRNNEVISGNGKHTISPTLAPQRKLLHSNFSLNAINVDGEKLIVKCAFVFDIDGVLLHGNKVLDGAKEALQLIRNANIPFIFLTNAGGMLESDKAKALSSVLGFHIDPEQLQMSHTPMVHLHNQYNSSRVMIVGSNEHRKVAESLGFMNTVTPQEYNEEFPNSYTFRKPAKSSPQGEPPSGIIIFNDPIDWHIEIQMISDVLLRYNHVKLHCSQNDFVFSNDFVLPRLALGSFVRALRHIMKLLRIERNEAANDFPIQFYGKPSKTAYKHATLLLANEAYKLQEKAAKYNSEIEFNDVLSSTTKKQPIIDINWRNDIVGDTKLENVIFEKIYAIGDNPSVDIKGANDAGDPWRSVLVRTGVFKSEGNDKQNPANFTFDNVFDAVKTILESNNLLPVS